MKNSEKIKSIKLRKEGNSLGEISKKLNISKSTASLWTKNIRLDFNGKKRIEEKAQSSRAKGHETLHKRKLKRLEIAEKVSDEMIESIKLSKDIEIVALSVMYWCEGIKSDNGIGFTNSNPELVKAFLNILHKIFEINLSRVQVCLHIHDYHNEKELIEFWSSFINIPINQFSIYRKESNHKYENSGYKGCVRLSYFDSHIARVILSFAKKFIKLYI